MEASHLIDLEKLVGDYPANILKPRDYNKSLLSRFPDNLILILLMFALFGFFLDWTNQETVQLGFIVVPLLLIFLFFRKIRIKNEYFVDSEGITVPYTWFTRQIIKMDEIVSISMEEEEIEIGEVTQIYKIIEITLDTSKIKYNITGLIDSRLVISELDHDSRHLQEFYTELQTFHRNAGMTANTQAERLSSQVNRAWNNRWKLILFRLLDSSSEFGYYLALVYYSSLILAKSATLFFSLILIFALYCIFVLAFHIMDRPNSIIGMRPHELGPIFYNEADLVTTIRFILVSQPNGVNLRNCELFFEDDPLPQQYKLDQLHPKETTPGKLTYGVAQYVGNHSKAIGASITFSYINESKEYSLPVYWGHV